jgi:hypothetical protein
MVRRIVISVGVALLVCFSLLPVSASGSSVATAAPSSRYRPDAWIKLCGQTTGCTVDPLPHPWLGNNVYNRTALHQRLRVRLDNGRGVWFWVTLQNDGTQRDTLVVQGCKGKRNFVLGRVLLGKHKRPDAGATNVTREFKRGTLEFTFPPSTTKKKKVFTVNIVTGKAEGVSYRCAIRVHSENRPTRVDTVTAELSTY